MSAALGYRRATLSDAAMLALLNQQLIEDERHRNAMTLPELETRMRDMLAADYSATLFERDDRVVAYALWREEPDYIYLRQFFVDRGFRRKGIGILAVRLLLGEVFPANKRIRVNVLVGNQPALDFWRAAGFEDYLITLEMERGS